MRSPSNGNADMTDQPTAGAALDMPLIIENVTGEPYPADDQPHRYIVRVNREPLASFEVVRSLGYAACLRAAADAIDPPTPASGPVEADDRLAVAVQALKKIDRAHGSKERATDKLILIKRAVSEALALLTSGGQPVTDTYKLEGGEAGE